MMKIATIGLFVVLGGCATEAPPSLAPAYTPRAVQAEVPPPPVNTSMPDAATPKSKASGQ